MSDIYSPFEATDAFFVGPHSILSRNGITFNDRQSLECYFVENFTGFDSSDLVLSAEPNVQQDGELPDPGFHGGRTMTMSGYIRCGDYPRFLRMARALLDSMVDLEELQMIVGVADGSSIFTQPDYQIFCRPADKPQIDTQLQRTDEQGLIKRTFTVALRAHIKPEFEALNQKYVKLIPTIPVTYMRSYDRTYDLAYNIAQGGGDPTNFATLVNLGNWYSKPIIRFNGAMSGVVLRNAANGHTIRLKYPISSGDYIEIDVDSGQIYDQNGTNRSSYFDTTSDWMLLEGRRGSQTGDNVVTVTASSFDALGSVEMWWRDTTI